MEIYETQPERTDLPLVVMPVIIESMIEPFEKNFELLKDIARVRMYKDFTLDEDTIVERCAEADAIMVIGFHCADSILDRLNAKCYAFGGTGVASYIDLDKAKERGIRVCNVVHYGDHAVAEHTIALLMELARQVGKLDRQVKTGDWDGADGYELYGKELGIIGLGGIGQVGAHENFFDDVLDLFDGRRRASRLDPFLGQFHHAGGQVQRLFFIGGAHRLQGFQNGVGDFFKIEGDLTSVPFDNGCDHVVRLVRSC